MDNSILSKEAPSGPNSGSLASESRKSSNGKLSALFQFGQLAQQDTMMLTFLLRKKMNFTTELPKRNPLVSYIVASAVKCEKFFPGSANEGPAFRMHAVVMMSGNPLLKELGAEEGSEGFYHILCHVRKVPGKRIEGPLPTAPRTRRSNTMDLGLTHPLPLELFSKEMAKPRQQKAEDRVSPTLFTPYLSQIDSSQIAKRLQASFINLPSQIKRRYSMPESVCSSH